MLHNVEVKNKNFFGKELEFHINMQGSWKGQIACIANVMTLEKDL